MNHFQFSFSPPTAGVPALCPFDLAERLADVQKLWLLMDYDGTLADFAPTPDHIDPDPELIDLLTQLAANPRLCVSVISGRRLSHIEKLVPVRGILRAGSYGIEMQTTDGQRINRLSYEDIRPTLEQIKPHWERIIAAQEGFYLEDKGWSLALHARFAEEDIARHVLSSARKILNDVIGTDLERYRVLGGHKFLEISSDLAHKGKTVSHLLENRNCPDALPIYIGDDDKDEEAFVIVQEAGGIAIVVTADERRSIADCRLRTYLETRAFLARLLSILAPSSESKSRISDATDQTLLT